MLPWKTLQLWYNGDKAAPSEMVDRIMNLNTHLHREEHFDNDRHQRCVDSLEQSFHENHSSMRDMLILGARTPDMARSSEAVFLWDAASRSPSAKIVSEDVQEAVEEARLFQKQYEGEVQSVFSRVQHHWHLKNKEGERVPMKYCKMRSTKKLCRVQDGFSEVSGAPPKR